MLSSGLQSHPSITDLRLPFNEIGDDGARIIARYIGHERSLIEQVRGLLSHGTRAVCLSAVC
jgi:hypothetical protein